VAFTNVLTICQMYHTLFHPLHHSPLSSPPHSWSSFNRYNFSIYIHVYTVLALYSASYILPPHPPLPLVPTHSLQTEPVPPSCSLILKKGKKVTFWFPYDISIYICMYYNANWFITSIFLLFTLVLFLG
jgi:hypothetical protein